MGFITSARKQVSPTATPVIPDSAQTPAAHTHFLSIVNAIEERLVLRVPTIAQAESAPYSIAPVVDGMLLITTSSPYEIYFRDGGVWRKIWPNIYNGVGAPAGGLGVDDDIYVQY